MTTGELAERAGVTPDTLRYYERRGLLPPPKRTAAGYRLYDQSTAELLAFIGKAKALGLTLDEIGEVLRISAAGTPPCAHVQAALSRRLREVETRIAELGELRSTLAQALRRSRELPASSSCLCDIIESHDARHPAALVPRGAARRRRAGTTTNQEVS